MKHNDTYADRPEVDNNERFNALLNSCAHPRQIYNALLALAEAGYTVACQGGKEIRPHAE